ncbi:hypothetical protein ACHAXS_007878 [Conticribra weissflogii]
MASSTMKSGLDLLSAAVKCINDSSAAPQTCSSSRASAQLMKAFQDAKRAADGHSPLPCRYQATASVSVCGPSSSSASTSRSASEDENEDEDDAGSSNSSNFNLNLNSNFKFMSSASANSASARPTGNALPLKKRLKMASSFADEPSITTANSSSASCVSRASSFAANSARSGVEAAPSLSVAFVQALSRQPVQQTPQFDSRRSHNNKRVATSQDIVDDDGHRVGMGYFSHDFASNPAGIGTQASDARSVSTSGSDASDKSGASSKTSSCLSSSSSSKSSRSRRSRKSKSHEKQRQHSTAVQEDVVGAAVTVWQRQLQQNFESEMASRNSSHPTQPSRPTVSPRGSRVTSPCTVKHLPPSDERRKLWQKQLQDNFNREVKSRALAELKKNCSAVASAFLPARESSSRVATSGSGARADVTEQRQLSCHPSPQQQPRPQDDRRTTPSPCITAPVTPAGPFVMTTPQEEQMKKLYQAYVSAVSER